MWVRVHVYNIYICVLCMNTWRHEHMVVCINEYMYVYVTSCMSTFIFAWSHIFMHIYVYVCMYACMYVWVYECMRDEHTWLCQCRHAQLLCLCLCPCLCLCLCLLVSSLLLPFFSKWVKERKGMERKAKQRDGMWTSVFCIVYTTRYVSCKVQY